jgi:hypothetical protein
MAVHNAYANPRPVDRASVRELVAAAYRGDAPSLTDPTAPLRDHTEGPHR